MLSQVKSHLVWIRREICTGRALFLSANKSKTFLYIKYVSGFWCERTTGDGCFHWRKLFGLSFWWHPFSAEGPLLSDLHHCLVRELQCCWPQDPPADSEDGCKDPIHPGHFPCTMLQQNQQHREGPHPPLPQSLPAPTIRKTVPEHQSPLRQTAQQLFSPGCESPELRSPRPPLKPHATPYLLKHGPPPPPPPKHPPPPTLPHRRKILWIFFVQSKCATHRWVGLYKPPVVTHSPLCTRHFSYIAICTQSHKRLRNICMFTCSCTTTNHLVLFPSQLLDSQCFSLHMYSIYVKHSHSLYSLYFLSLS